MTTRLSKQEQNYCYRLSENIRWILPKDKSEFTLLSGATCCLYLYFGPYALFFSPLLQLGQALTRRTVQPITDLSGEDHPSTPVDLTNEPRTLPNVVDLSHEPMGNFTDLSGVDDKFVDLSEEGHPSTPVDLTADDATFIDSDDDVDTAMRILRGERLSKKELEAFRRKN